MGQGFTSTQFALTRQVSLEVSLFRGSSRRKARLRRFSVSSHVLPHCRLDRLVPHLLHEDLASPGLPTVHRTSAAGRGRWRTSPFPPSGRPRRPRYRLVEQSSNDRVLPALVGLIEFVPTTADRVCRVVSFPADTRHTIRSSNEATNSSGLRFRMASAILKLTSLVRLVLRFAELAMPSAKYRVSTRYSTGCPSCFGPP